MLTEAMDPDRDLSHDDGPAADAAGPSRVTGPQDTPGHGPGRAGRPGLLRRAASAASPLHVVAGMAMFALGWSVPGWISDLDSYWHVVLGREIISRRSLDGLGHAWLGVPAPDWSTSMWLSEVAMGSAVDAFGWRALVVGRCVVLVAVAAILAATLLPRRPGLLVMPVVVSFALGLGVVAQERPQSVSYIFVALLAASCVRLFTDGRRPPPLVVAALCLLWAQLHGLWILAPAAYVLVALGALPGARRHATSRVVVRHAVVAAAASLAGLVNPLGLRSLLLPFTLKAAGSEVIGEWMPTSVSSPWVIGWFLLVAYGVLAWAAGGTRVPTVELVWVFAWSAFGLLAYRNVMVSAVMLAPAVLHAADRAWGDRVRRRSAPAGPREGAALLVASMALVVGGVGLLVAHAVTTDPLEKTPALRIAQRLAASPEPVRVFNAYNSTGALIAFGGGKVRLAFDARADMWGSEGIATMTDAQLLRPGWDRTVAAFDPDAFVLMKDSALTQLLVREGRWRVDLTDGEYVLLVPAR